MDPLSFILLIISGFFIGVISIMVGIGGGLVYNPLLIFLFEMDPRLASVISSFVIIFTSGSGFLKYRAANRVDYESAKAFLILAVPGAVIGAFLSTIIPSSQIKLLFAILIGASAIRGIYKAVSASAESLISEEKGKELDLPKRSFVDADGDKIEYYVNLKISQPLAIFGGLVAGLLGVGGGIIFSPLLVTLAGLPVHIAMATSASMISVVSIVALITKIIGFAGTGLLTLNDFITIGIPLAIGAVTGARYGAGKVKKIDSRNLLFLFWGIALFSSLRMGGII